MNQGPERQGFEIFGESELDKKDMRTNGVRQVEQVKCECKDCNRRKCILISMHFNVAVR